MVSRIKDGQDRVGLTKPTLLFTKEFECSGSEDMQLKGTASIRLSCQSLSHTTAEYRMRTVDAGTSRLCPSLEDEGAASMYQAQQRDPSI